MNQIEDGTGSGKTAKVNRFNQLSTLSESIPSEGFQSEKGKSFIIHFECHLAAAAAGGLMQILNNDTEFDLEVTRIYIDPHVITPTDLIMTQVFDVTPTGGTSHPEAIVQKNRGSAEDFNLTVTCSDSVSDLTYTGGVKYHAFPIKSMTPIQRNMNSTNILAAKKSITWGFFTRGGGNATDGEIISLSVNVIKRNRSDI